MFDQPVFYSWCSFKSTDYAPGCTVATIYFFSIFSIVMGEFKTRCGPCKTKYYQGCSKPLFVGNFLATRGEGNPIVMGLGATRFWLDHFRSWTFTLQPFFDRETSPEWVNLGGDIEDGYPTKITRVYPHGCLSPWMFIPMDVEPLIV